MQLAKHYANMQVLYYASMSPKAMQHDHAMIGLEPQWADLSPPSKQ